MFRSTWWSVAEAAAHAGLWSVLPMLVFPAQPWSAQAMLGAATGTMMAGAFLLAIVPLAATDVGIDAGGRADYGGCTGRVARRWPAG